MENSRKAEKGPFRINGKQSVRNSSYVSENPLFIDAREVESEMDRKRPWHTRVLCLRHGERFRWKNRCARCHYLIRFHARRVG